MSESNQNKPVKLGIIGSGLAVKYLHAPAIKKLKGKYEIVVSCARSEKSARDGVTLAQQELDSPNCSWTTDYKEVLANPEVEAVLLSLPIQLNAQFIFEAAQAGKHIIAEKPLAANLNEAEQLVEKLRPFNQLVIEIAENFHYREDFLKAKEWLNAGRVGQVFLIEIHQRFWMDTSKGFASTPWRYSNEFRGGLVADGGVHCAAALRELGGEVKQLQAFAKTMHPDSRDADTLLLNLQFESGAIGNLLFTGAVKSRNVSPLYGRVCGTEGAVELYDGRVVLTKGAHPKAEVVEEFEVADFDNGYTGEFLNFYQAIREGAKVLSTAEDAYKDMRIIMRALDSSDDGGTSVSI
jgi:predicted dehydrogenase